MNLGLLEEALHLSAYPPLDRVFVVRCSVVAVEASFLQVVLRQLLRTVCALQHTRESAYNRLAATGTARLAWVGEWCS